MKNEEFDAAMQKCQLSIINYQLFFVLLQPK